MAILHYCLWTCGKKTRCSESTWWGKAAYLVLARKQRQKKGLRSNGHVKRIPTVN